MSEQQKTSLLRDRPIHAVTSRSSPQLRSKLVFYEPQAMRHDSHNDLPHNTVASMKEDSHRETRGWGRHVGRGTEPMCKPWFTRTSAES